MSTLFCIPTIWFTLSYEVNFHIYLNLEFCKLVGYIKFDLVPASQLLLSVQYILASKKNCVFVVEIGYLSCVQVFYRLFIVEWKWHCCWFGPFCSHVFLYIIVCSFHFVWFSFWVILDVIQYFRDLAVIWVDMRHCYA